MSAAAIEAADRATAWASADLAKIRDRWDTNDGPRRAALALTGETRIPPHQAHDVLEILRTARADVLHLLRILDLIAKEA